MERHWTFAQYRTADLCAFAAIGAVTELVMTLAATRWFPAQLYTVSAAASVCAIVLMRWGPWAAIQAVIGGVVFALASGGSAKQIAVYAIGNLGCLLLLPLRRWGEHIQRDKLLTIVFALTAALSMQLGRALTALVLGAEISSCVGFFTTDTLTDLFTVVVVSLARRLDGIFEDQKSYLLRVQRERGGL